MTSWNRDPFWRTSIGFDRLFDLINSNAQQLPTQEPGFPPYDITRTGDDSYRITLAIAGFSPDEIAITAQQNLLTVAGNKPDDGKQEFVHRGITGRNFDRHFSLADHVEVVGATCENGLLQIELVRRIPEAMKPRRIPINGKKNGKAT